MVSESLIKPNESQNFSLASAEVRTSVDSARRDLMFTWILFWSGHPVMVFCQNLPSQVSKCGGTAESLTWYLLTPCQNPLTHGFLLLTAQSQACWERPTAAQPSEAVDHKPRRNSVLTEKMTVHPAN